MSWFGARRSPPAGWEAHFLIAIFSDGREPRWCKLQLFSGGLRSRWWCLSAVEGMAGGGKEHLLLGFRDRIEESVHDLPARDFERDASRWGVRTPRLRWDGDFPDLELRGDGVDVRTHTPHVVTWTKLGALLTYRTAIGTLQWNGRPGTALVEHAWGAQSPIALDRLIPRRWQWDVLCFEEGRACAALSIARSKVRGGGGLDPDGTLRRSRGLSVRSDTSGWGGTMDLAGERVRYEATRTTPIAAAFPGGGFTGFSFEGEWRGRPIAGAGFSEQRTSS